MTPPWFRLQILTSDRALTVGSQLHYRMRWRGFPFRWQSEITEWQSPHRFTYRQARGPFKYFEHDPVIEELYDLKADPLEQNNLASDAQYAEILSKLRDKTRELHAHATE